jgi:hypothetical protein
MLESSASPLSTSTSNVIKKHDNEVQPIAEEILISNGRSVPKLDPNQHALLRLLSLGERIKGGKSILIIHNLVTSTEVEFLKSSSIDAAKQWKRQQQPKQKQQQNDNNIEDIDDNNGNKVMFLEQGIQGKVFVRLLTKATAKRENAPNDVLPESVSDLVDKILERTLSFIDTKVSSSLKETLFFEEAEDNNNSNTREDGDKTITSSIAALFRHDQLDFSIREPAINV